LSKSVRQLKEKAKENLVQCSRGEAEATAARKREARGDSGTNHVPDTEVRMLRREDDQSAIGGNDQEIVCERGNVQFSSKQLGYEKNLR